MIVDARVDSATNPVLLAMGVIALSGWATIPTSDLQDDVIEEMTTCSAFWGRSGDGFPRCACLQVGRRYKLLVNVNCGETSEKIKTTYLIHVFFETLTLWFIEA